MKYPKVRFLDLGNGHQAANREKARKAAEKLVAGLRPINQNTVEIEDFGTCHFAAFAHPKGAMISSTASEDTSFGGLDWHSKGNIAMFRDVGDGRCFLYICPIEPLFALRTIGHHGVTWENVKKVSKRVHVFPTVDVIAAAA